MQKYYANNIFTKQLVFTASCCEVCFSNFLKSPFYFLDILKMSKKYFNLLIMQAFQTILTLIDFPT